MPILKPDAFNERFTLYLNAEGKPVQRTLGEMTAAEVALAVEWQEAEAIRLEVEADQAREIAAALEDKRADGITFADIYAAGAKLQAAAEAENRSVRLLELVQAKLPLWRRRDPFPLAEALKRWWPGG